jgi:hypothetical protein
MHDQIMLSPTPKTSTQSISMIRSAITVESSTSFETSSSVQVAAKPSPAMSKLARGFETSSSVQVAVKPSPAMSKLARGVEGHQNPEG